MIPTMIQYKTRGSFTAYNTDYPAHTMSAGPLGIRQNAQKVVKVTLVYIRENTISTSG